MGNSLFKRIFGKREVSILFQGLDTSGKTTAFYRLKLEEIVTTTPTIGFNVETVKVKDVKVIAWDVGLRDKDRSIYKHFYKHIKGIVYLIDSNDRDRFDEAADELIGMSNEEELRGVPFLILANKQDLPNAQTVEEISEKLAPHMSTDRSWSVFGVSAAYKHQQSTGLNEALEWLTDVIVSQEKEHEIRKWVPHLVEAEEKVDNITDDTKAENKDSDGKVNRWCVGSLMGTLKSMLYRAS